MKNEITTTTMRATAPGKILQLCPLSHHQSAMMMRSLCQKQASSTQNRSLPNSAFWPLVNIVEMVANCNCGFRAAAHIIHGRESVWPEARQHLLDHLNSDPAGYLPDVAITSSAEMSLQSLQASLMHFAGPIWDRSKWFDSDKHVQLTADAYDTFVVMGTYDYSNIVIRAPSSFRSAEAIRAAIPTARLLGMVLAAAAVQGTGIA